MSRLSRSRSFEPEGFGKYFLVDRIATGGMAEIFKAKTFSHGGFENLLVIKRILPHISDNHEFVDMFVDEAKISAALQHANVVRIYDFGRILDNYFIAMECVDGKDVRNILRKLARQRTFLPPRFCAFIAHEVCKGLHYAHTRTDLHGRPYGIVHRDVSPSNLLVSYDADVKIVDFGIAKARSNAYQTRDGILKGKFEYMSPEQADGAEIDHRSDLFSLGICMYEMMTNRRLFKTDSELATIRRIQACDFKPPRAFNPDLPPELEAICLKALSREPAERYASAREMGDALRSFLFPSTTESLRNELREFMQEVFDVERDEELRRLEHGTHVAVRLREQGFADTSFDGDTRPSVPAPHELTPPPSSGRAGTWFAGVGVMLMGLASVGVVGLAALLFVRPDLQQSALESVDSLERYVRDLLPEPATGLDVVVLPDARIYVDGQLAATGRNAVLSDLSPGLHTVRLEAEGHATWEGEVEVQEGHLERLIQQLEELPGVPPPRRVGPRGGARITPSASRPSSEGPSEDAAEASEEIEAAVLVPGALPDGDAVEGEGEEVPLVMLSSRPAGATVRIDGQSVGTTPLLWTGGEAGEAYEVDMQLAGHRQAKGTLLDLQPGSNPPFSLTLEAEPEAPARLDVLLVTDGWAEVFIDGRKLERPAPVRGLELPSGEHEIRVVNAELGIDQTLVKTFQPGQTETIRIK